MAEKKQEVVVVNTKPVEKEKPEEKKMTLDEYMNKYSGKQSFKNAKVFLVLAVLSIGVIIAALLTMVVLRLFDFHQIAGYIGIGLAVIIFIAAYVVPVVKVSKLKPFMVDVNQKNAAVAKRYNRKLRGEIADRMIELATETEVRDWYSEGAIGRLAIARHSGNDKKLKLALSELYNGDIKKKAGNIIRDYAVRVGITTGISQSEKLDTLFVATFELNLIKKLIYLYGYRPSDARLLRIYAAVLRNSLIAYGVSSVSQGVAVSLVNTVGGALESIPLLGAAVGAAIGSATQAIVNGSMTVVIGYQTLRYLAKDYHLQDILDEIEVEDETEEEAMDEVKKEIMTNVKEAKKNRRKVAA